MGVILQAITPKRMFVDTNVLTKSIKANMKQYTDSVKEELQKYPPEVPPQQRMSPGNRVRAEQAAAMRGEEFSAPGRWRRYKRTKRLQGGWKSVVTPDGSQGFVFNDVKYAVFVQGPKGGGRGVGQRQTKLNRSRGWKSISDISRAKAKEFETLMNRSVKGSIRTIS